MEDILAIVGIFFVPFIMVILIIWLKADERNKRNRLQADLYAKALEKGQPVPAELFALPKKKANPLHTGIICIAVGIGVAVFFWLVNDGEDQAKAVAFGIIPFLIGVAFLIIHCIEKKQNADENAR